MPLVQLKRKIAKKVFLEVFLAISEDLREQAMFAEHGEEESQDGDHFVKT